MELEIVDDSLEPNPTLSYSIKIRGDIVTIYINGLIHLWFERSNIDFIKAEQSSYSWWEIEFTLKSGNIIIATYDNFPKFKAITEKLRKLIRDVVIIDKDGIFHLYFEKNNIDFIKTSQNNLTVWEIFFYLKTNKKILSTYKEFKIFESVIHQVNLISKQ